MIETVLLATNCGRPAGCVLLRASDLLSSALENTRLPPLTPSFFLLRDWVFTRSNHQLTTLTSKADWWHYIPAGETRLKVLEQQVWGTQSNEVADWLSERE